MRREPIGIGRLPITGRLPTHISSSIGVDLPIPEKPASPVREGSRLAGWHPRYVMEYKGSSRVAINPPSGSLFAASGHSCGSTAA